MYSSSPLQAIRAMALLAIWVAFTASLVLALNYRSLVLLLLSLGVGFVLAIIIREEDPTSDKHN